MYHYDHRMHAGNAGDVWKHFFLLEAADYLLASDGSLVYAESHVGRPEYTLRESGDWEGGIGKIRPLLPSPGNFCYFDILADLNPIEYPGSARFIYELAKRKRANLVADVWDNDPDVAGSWETFTQKATAESSGSFPAAKIVFHQGDGFLGVRSFLGRSPAGLLFIDPPYKDSADFLLAEKLLQRAKDLHWIVLWWYMTDMFTASDDLQTFELQFAEVGLEGGRWKGAVMALAGVDGERFEHLTSHMHRQIKKLVRVLNR